MWRGGSRLWKDRMLVCGAEDRSAKDQILLCGSTDTSGTEPDHALGWKYDVSLQWRAQDVRVVYKALFMGRRRRPDWSQLTAAWQSDMPSLSEASKKMLKQEVATEVAFLDRTSLLILADDWFGKWVEKFLKVCNR